MILCILVAAATAAAGFGVGRLKNASTIATVQAEIAKIETTASADLKTFVADIKAKLNL